MASNRLSYFHLFFSVRKHLVQKLTDEGLPPNQIIQISGHKNVNSLNNYSHLKAEQTKNISSILSNRPPVKNPTVSATISSCAAVDESPVEVRSTANECQAPTSRATPQSYVPVLNHGGFDISKIGGMFSGNQIHGNININFNQSQQLSRTQSYSTTCVSPTQRMSLQFSPPARKSYKRIRVIDSDSD